jgi:cytochrome c biogenesis protein CcmG/thiol:disulfide interchange protein DsbE
MACGKLSLVVKPLPYLAFTAAILALVGCGGGHAHSDAPSRASVNAAFKGSPPPLASLHEGANQLVNGGQPAFSSLLKGLHGYPVVVNKWASWCTPCQSEFPVFQKVAVVYGKKVAFVGIDGKDTKPAASAFLRSFPITYPSYLDPHEDIARSIQAATYYPQTVFYNRQGKSVYDHAGPYESPAALERDIRRYVLG